MLVLVAAISISSTRTAIAQSGPARFSRPKRPQETKPSRHESDISSDKPKRGEQESDDPKNRPPKKRRTVPTPKPVSPPKTDPEDAETKAEIATMKAEIAALKEALEEARVVAKPPTPRGLTPVQQREKDTYEAKLVVAEKELQSFKQAIEGGLDPALVKNNMDKLTFQIADLQEKIALLNAAADTPTPAPPTLDEEAAAIAEELEKVKAELAVVKAAQQKALAQEPAEAAVQGEEKTEKKTGLLEEIGAILPIELFAFGDFLFAYRQEGKHGFEIGQLELDFNQELGQFVTVSVAVAFDNEKETFGVGAYVIDGKLIGREAGHIIRSNHLETAGIIFGRFDVPFGVDYLAYPSIDRRLVTGPIVVDETHDAWNDLGGQFYLDANVFNIILYVINGFGYETIRTTRNADDTETATHETDVAIGARLGAKPLSQLEFGGSYAMFVSAKEGYDMMLAGADLTAEAGGFSLKNEYIFHWLGVSGNEGSRNHGFYSTAMYDFNPVFVVGRYSMFFPEKNTPSFIEVADPQKQLSAGLGVKVLDNAEVRLEYTSTLEAEGNAVYIQLAGGVAWQPTGLRR
jgi:hypothetical protein